MAHINLKKSSVIAGKKILTTEIDKQGFALYVCNENRINAVLHPKFSNRKQARQHVIKVHLKYPYYA